MKIFYICTHNRCRSILSEAISNQLGNGIIQAFSAGSQPAGEVHPLSIKYLAVKGYSVKGLRSQSWDEFESEQPDIVITVCDSAAEETCPTRFGNTIKVHWPLADPSKLKGSEQDIENAFFDAINTIEQRVQKLLAIDFDNLPAQDKQSAIQRITLS